MVSPLQRESPDQVRHSRYFSSHRHLMNVCVKKLEWYKHLVMLVGHLH